MKQAEKRSQGSAFDDVTQWRIRLLVEAGVIYRVALRLALTTEADLHNMVRDKELGCPDDLLLRIYQ